MAALAPAQAACVIQLDLASILGVNNPAIREIAKQGFTSALRSEINTRGFVAIPVQSNGSRPLSTNKRKVQVQYRVANCDTVSSGDMVCTDEDNEEGDPYSYVEVEVANYKKSKQVKLSRAAYMDLCNGLATEQSVRVGELAADILRTRNADLITEYYATLTDYADGTSSIPGGGAEKNIALFSSASVPQPMGLMPLLNQYVRKGYTDEPITVGGYQLNSWMKAQGLFTGNLDGSDINKLNLSYAFFDNTVDTVVNALASDTDQHLFSFVPGQVQYLEWLRYAPETGLARTTDEVTKEVITIGGQNFDILINDSACGEYVNIQLGLGYGLFVPPSAAFGATCKGQEANLSWTLDCAALDCDTVK